MGSKVSLKLGSEDRGRLLRIILRGENWRERERAQTLIHLDDGLSLAQAAERVGGYMLELPDSRAWID